MSKALEAINKAKNVEVKHKELKAQILYRLEKFDESYAVYRDILKNTSDDEFEVIARSQSIVILCKSLGYCVVNVITVSVKI